MSQIVAATREINDEQFHMSLIPGTYLEEELRGAMRDFLSYMAANPRTPLGPVRVKIVVEQEVI